MASDPKKPPGWAWASVRTDVDESVPSMTHVLPPPPPDRCLTVGEAWERVANEAAPLLDEAEACGYAQAIADVCAWLRTRRGSDHEVADEIEEHFGAREDGSDGE